MTANAHPKNMSRIRLFYQKHLIVRMLFSPVVFLRKTLGINHAAKQALRDLDRNVIVGNLRSLLADDPVLKLEDYNGSFKLATSSDLFARVIRDRTYEPEMAHLVEEFLPRNRDVIDVGANVGFFAVKFAKLIARQKVLAVEPTENALRFLRDNLRRNEVDNRVTVFPGVASDKEGSVELNFIAGKEEYSSIGVIAHPSVAGQNQDLIKVSAKTLDSLAEENSISAGFLKVDVEGAEHLVFKGAKEILKKHRPIVLSELCDPLLRRNNSSAQEVIQMLRDQSYDIYDAGDPDSPPGSDPYGNIICFPSEMKMSKETFRKRLLPEGK